METTYEYFKAVFMPFAYTGMKYVPDRPQQNNRGILNASAVDQSYTVGPGGVVEALMICPFLSTTQPSSSSMVLFLSGLGPTSNGTVFQRYTHTNVLRVSTIQNPVSLHMACGSIHADDPVTYEACMFVKTTGDASQLPDDVFSFNTKYSGVLQPPNKLWINTIPVNFSKKSNDYLNNVYLPGTNVHYIVRITNTGTNPTTVYVRGNATSAVVDRELIVGNIVSVPLKTSPSGFTHYVLERLRNKHCFMVLNDTDPAAVATKKIEIEADIKNEINELAKNWYDLMKAVPGIDLTKLINFIIFYLE